MIEKSKSKIHIFSLAVTIGLLVFLFWKYDFTNFWSSLSPQYMSYILFAAIFLLIIRWIDAFQLTKLLQIHNIIKSSFTVYRYQIIAGFYTLFLPGLVVGGGVTWFLLTRNGENKTSVVNALAMSRLIHFIVVTLVGLAMTYLNTFQFINAMYLKGILFGILILFILILSPVLVKSFRAFLANFFDALFSNLKWNKLKEISNRFFESLNQVGQIKKRSALLLVSCSLLSIYFDALWLNGFIWALDIPLSFTACVWIRCILVILSSFQITFGGIGLREVTTVGILHEVYGIDPGVALVVSLSMFSTTVLMYGSLGLFLNAKKITNRA